MLATTEGQVPKIKNEAGVRKVQTSWPTVWFGPLHGGRRWISERLRIGNKLVVSTANQLVKAGRDAELADTQYISTNVLNNDRYIFID